MVLNSNDDDGRKERKGANPAEASPRTSKPRRPSRSLFLPLFGFHPRSGVGGTVIGRGERPAAGGGGGGHQERERDDREVREREQEDKNKTTASRRRDRDRDYHERDRDRDRHHRHHRNADQQAGNSNPPTGPAAATSSPSATCPRHARRSIRVELKSLDPSHHDWPVLVKDGCPVMKLEQTIRRNFERNHRALDAAVLFRFFAPDGRELTQEDTVTPALRQVWYRVSRFSGQVESWKFTHYQDDTHGRLDSAFTGELVTDIEAGATVKQLRKKIAERWDIEDANRVVLIAKGGFRPGSIKGQCWEVRRVKEKWLCRWIAIDVCHRKRYIVLKGLKREYLLHPDRPHTDIGEVKMMMCDKLFRAVRQHGKSDFNLALRRIILTTQDGQAPRNRDRAEWGAVYSFELPVHEAEVFSDEETWLLPPTETCMICVDDKRVTELPVRITAKCQHEPTTCKPCLDQWLQSSLESGTWDRLKCPECPELLEHADVHRYASKTTFSRYDELATRAALKDMPNFRWCLSTACTSGQIDDEACTKFKCKECKSSHCIRHNVPWHKGETCDEYDRRNKKRLKDEKASEDMIKKTTKKCPECKKDVHKYTGCNHITCVCGHEWCYICFAKFERNHVGFLFCRHDPSCTERDPFIDLIDNPPPPPLLNLNNNANGNRANGGGLFQAVFPPNPPIVPRNHPQHLRPGRQRPQARPPPPPPPHHHIPPPPPPPPPPHAGPPPRMPAGFGPPPPGQWEFIHHAPGVHVHLPFQPPPPPPPPHHGQQHRQAPLFVGAALIHHHHHQIHQMHHQIHHQIHNQIHNSIANGVPITEAMIEATQRMAVMQGVHGLQHAARMLDEARMMDLQHQQQRQQQQHQLDQLEQWLLATRQ